MIAIGVAVAVGLGSPGPVPRPGSPPPQVVKDVAKTRVAKATKGLTRMELRWQSRGYRVNTRADADFACAAHSYGEVHDFFVAHECDLLIRAYGSFRDRRGNTILVAYSWVSMLTDGEATRYKTLVDTGGTGNVTELSREGWRYRNVRYQGLGYASGIDGRAVWNVQVQPVARRSGNALLNQMRREILAAMR